MLLDLMPMIRFGLTEPYFRGAEREFCLLFSDRYSAKEVSAKLFATEMQNLASYGYGVKAFTLSLIETALQIDSKCKLSIIKRIVELGRSILDKPVVLLDGVREVLDALKSRYRLIVATKGDLLDQQRKLKKLNLEHYFHHVEVMSDKKEESYAALINHLDVKPENFLMGGTSFKRHITEK